MIKLVLLVLFLSEMGIDFDPIYYLSTLDRQATCTAIVKRFAKCAPPQIAAIFSKAGMRKRMQRECVKLGNKKDYRKAVRCMREKTCSRFMSCIMR